jgi:uncharacterized membrane protein
MARIYYIGDWAVQTGPVYAKTAFNYAYKGLEVINYGKWLKDALETAGHEVESVPTWDFYGLPPGAYETVLAEHDVIVFSDVEAKNFQLSPSFFDRRKFGSGILTFPDRVRLTVEAVRAGKRVAFMGGWLSFNGECGKGGWGRTGLEEILPVECLEVEDLVESTEGFRAVPAAGSALAPVLAGGSFPPVLGYNRALPRSGCEILAYWERMDSSSASAARKPRPTSLEPAVAIGDFGRGRTLAYTSDPAPHWGCNFVFWEGYAEFWRTCFDLLLQ